MFHKTFGLMVLKDVEVCIYYIFISQPKKVENTKVQKPRLCIYPGSHSQFSFRILETEYLKKVLSFLLSL